MKFDLLSHSLEAQSVLQKKAQLLDEMSVPTLAKHSQLSNHDGKISTTPKEILKAAFLKVVSPSPLESNDDDDDDDDDDDQQRGRGEGSTDTHSDIILTLREIKELNPNEIHAILGHFTNMSNDVSSLSKMGKELINSHIFRGFGLPDREIFLKVMEEAQRSSSSSGRVSRKMIPLEQTVELLTSNAIGTDALTYFDPSVYYAQIQIDLDRMDDGGDDRKKRKKIVGKRNKSKLSAFLLREKEIQQKVKRNMRHQLVRRFHNMKSLERYANSGTPFPIRNLSLFKLNKIRNIFEGLKGKEIYDLKKNPKDLPIAYNCFICETSTPDQNRDDDDDDDDDDVSTAGDDKMVFTDRTYAGINVHRLMPLDGIDEVKKHYLAKHSCEATLPSRKKLECADKEHHKLQLDREQIQNLPSTENKHLFVLHCMFCRSTNSEGKTSSLFCCLRCGRDHLFAHHGKDDIFHVVREELQRKWIQNSFHVDIVNQFLDVRCCMCFELHDNKKIRIRHEEVNCLPRQLTQWSKFCFCFFYFFKDFLQLIYIYIYIKSLKKFKTKL